MCLHAYAFTVHRYLAIRTKWADRLAQVLSVGDKQIVIDDPVPARQFLPQRHFGIVGSLRSDIAQPVRNPMHVRIDGNSMLPESKRNNDVCGLPAHTRQLQKFVQSTRHLSTKPAQELIA